VRRSAILVATDVVPDPQEESLSRRLVSSNTPGERLANFSRAVRVGDMVFVSGTTASDEAGAAQHPSNADAQTIYVLRKIESALEEAGATLADVVRTRVFVRNIEDSEAVARAHGSIFRRHSPRQYIAARRTDRLGNAG
jgi:enamine deaminase RidA (YjgF/YER057c/UK114 family)